MKQRVYAVGIAFGVAAALLLPCNAAAEVSEVRIARGFAIPHLPIMVMEHEKLLEKHAKAGGLGDIKAIYSTIGGGSVMNDALLSGSLSFGVGGPPPMLTLWDKTRSSIQVKGVCAEATMPLLLNTRNPALRTVRDLTDKDRIAVGAVKVSIQAVMLQMAAAKAFGDANYTKLDALTVGMNSPDATAMLRSGAGEVNSNFSIPPFQYAELKVPGIHTLLSSNEILDGPHTFTLVYTTNRFHDANPRTYRAFLASDQGSDRPHQQRQAARRADLPGDDEQQGEARRYPRRARRSSGEVHDDAGRHDEVRRVHASHRLAEDEAGVVEGLFLRRDSRPARKLAGPMASVSLRRPGQAVRRHEGRARDRSRHRAR